ncbi:MAG: alpha/beta hydrolase [Alphaproteobacteria bacterium]|nr:alpha/beta hydrolase [Alphaproteobacteria bacterium]
MWKKILLGIAAVVVVALGSLYYALYQPDIPRRVLEAKYAAPPSQFVVLNDGARVHYRLRGPADALVLVLLHGSNSSLFDWEPWSKNLSDRFRVVTVDLPGHGLTGAVPNGDYSEQGMAVFVKAFADKLGLGRFAIGGNSMGGGVAARFAELYPQRVTQLILVDAADMQTAFGDRLPLAFRLARTPVLNRLLLHITPRSLVVEGLNDAIVRKAALTNTLIDEYWDFARMAGTRQATIARFQLQPDTYVRDHVGAIKVPTLVLWGEKDHLIPVAAAHAWAKAIPGAKLIVYPDTGHLPMEEDPVETADAVRAFLGTQTH